MKTIFDFKYGRIKRVILTSASFMALILLVLTCEDVEPEPVLIIHTDTISDYSHNHFTVEGMISHVGKEEIIQHGFCWSESINPSVDNNTKVQLGTKEKAGSFSQIVTDLTANTTYYVRAFASNADNTKYGEEREITTNNAPVIPSITTTFALEITESSARSGGNITDDGGAPVTARGVCWSKNPNPTIADNHTTDGDGKGFFSSVLSNLECETVYYLKAYATNSAGTGYGAEDSFSTNKCPGNLPTVTTSQITAITDSSAQGGGVVTDMGGSDIIERGVCWSTSQSPTISDDRATEGPGTGSFASSITGLECATTYFVRAFATNSDGTAYGTQLEFTTSNCQGEIPTVTTAEITSITEFSAQGGGNVSDDGGSSITERGVCWSTSQSPTISGSHTSDGAGTGSFSSSLTELECNTTYYVKAFATNSNGTAYGDEMSFTTTACPAGLPEVTTTPVTEITETSAQSGGNVTDDGGSQVTARGVCWSTSQNPSLLDNKSSDESGTGSFSSSIADLVCATTYYVRAYATNENGTAYGSEVSFTTSECPANLPTVTTLIISIITETTAQGGGNVTDDGGAEVTARGVCWSTTQDPTISDSKSTDGTGTGEFTSLLSDLVCETTYYVRAYATNSAGTAYGSQINFTSSDCPANLPTVSTAGLSNITESSAQGGGFVSADGGQPVTAKGVCWSIAESPTISDSHTTDGMGTGIYTSAITELECNTTYYVRAYATNSAGTSYGDQKTFTTNVCPVVFPTVITAEITDITISETSAQGGGNVTDDGGGEVTARGVCWSTTQEPTILDSKTSDGTGTGEFTSTLINLLCGTTYYVRAYATNSAGTQYGSEVSFTTIACPVILPAVTTSAIGIITETTAQGGGNVTDDGGGEVTARGVCWSKSQDPTISDSKSTDGSGTGEFTSTIKGLECNTTYYVRAYATNSAGTEYGAQVRFTTLECPAIPPTVTTTSISFRTNNSAWSGGNVTDDGGAEVTERGVCWSTSTLPTISDKRTQDGTGTGTFTSYISGLSKNTTYYVRAYATNSVDTAYGEEVSFKTRK